MKKYKVLQAFIDQNTRVLNKVGDVIKLTDERAEEIRENLATYNGEFIELIIDEKADDEAEEKEEKPKGRNKKSE